MIFEIKLGESINSKDTREVVKREAVKGVILNQEELILLKSKKGDYKFPGGGMKQNEDHHKTLKREIEEELGYLDVKINKLLGKVTESYTDKFDKNKIFCMESYYYLCEINGRKVNRKLDEYEKELKLEEKKISLTGALEKNIYTKEINDWTIRETMVILALKNYKDKGEKNE